MGKKVHLRPPSVDNKTSTIAQVKLLTPNQFTVAPPISAKSEVKPPQIPAPPNLNSQPNPLMQGPPKIVGLSNRNPQKSNNLITQPPDLPRVQPNQIVLKLSENIGPTEAYTPGVSSSNTANSIEHNKSNPHQGGINLPPPLIKNNPPALKNTSPFMPSSVSPVPPLITSKDTPTPYPAPPENNHFYNLPPSVPPPLPRNEDNKFQPNTFYDPQHSVFITPELHPVENFSRPPPNPTDFCKNIPIKRERSETQPPPPLNALSQFLHPSNFKTYDQPLKTCVFSIIPKATQEISMDSTRLQHEFTSPPPLHSTSSYMTTDHKSSSLPMGSNIFSRNASEIKPNQSYCPVTIPPPKLSNENPFSMGEITQSVVGNKKCVFSVVPEVKLAVVKKPKTAEEMLAETSCEYCRGMNPSYLASCGHYYHLECLSEVAKRGSNCITCATHLDLHVFPIKTKNECQICCSYSNLTTCSCGSNYCYFCIRYGSEIMNNEMNYDCCKLLVKLRTGICINCPGCEMQRFFEDIVPISCPTHNLLCKKCWSLGVSLNQCIFGCNLSSKLEEIINCQVCRGKDKRYYGEFICPQHCLVCEECQYRGFIYSEYKNMDCVVCDSRLQKKDVAWN